MDPILLRIPIPAFLQHALHLNASLPIYGYGLMLVIGFLLSVELAKFLARRSGLDPEFFVNAGLIALVSGVIGSRLSHVLENWDYYTDPTRTFAQNMWNAVNITSGGLTFYGGLILGAACVLVYILYKKVPVRLAMDIIAPTIMIGLGIGRVGCFLNGCCYGAETAVPWAVHFPYGSIPYVDQVEAGKPLPRADDLDLVRNGRLVTPTEAKADPTLAAEADREHSLGVHPAQLYSTFTALLLAGVVTAFFTLPHAPGRGFALMLMLEGPARFVLEMLRTEPPVIGSWSLSMVLGAVVCAVGVVLWVLFGYLNRAAHRSINFATTGLAT